MRILFLGTPEFAVPSLEMLVQNHFHVIGVVTQPDKPKGRGHKLAAPPVKECALKYGIPVYQPPRIKNPAFVRTLQELKPDLMITAAYGQILSRAILDIPRYGCINVHASLLPKYRGAMPIHWAVINGERVTGITTMFTDIGMDTGDTALKREVEIGKEETAGELHDRLSVLGAEVLLQTLKQLEEGTLPRVAQNQEEATYFPIIKKEFGEIKWDKPAREIQNLIRGVTPWPGAYTFYAGEKMRVWKARVAEEKFSGSPGTILKVDGRGMFVSTGEEVLLIEELQFNNSKRMHVKEYILGHKINPGAVLTGVHDT